VNLPNPPKDEEARMDVVAEMSEVLARRRYLLRTLYLLFAVLLLGAVIAAVFVGPRAIVACLLSPALLAAYLLADTLLLLRWRRRLARAWLLGRINLGVVAGALRALPSFPQTTIDALLRTLPIVPALRDRDLTEAERVAMAAFSDWRWTEETAAALLPGCIVGLLSAGITSLLLTAAALNTAAAAILSGLIVAAILLRLGLPERRRWRLASTLAAMTPECRRALLELARSLDWSGTPASRRDRMLRTLQGIRPDARAGL
jgi:hypothetical protein